MAKVVIVGAGLMGSAMCWPLVDNGHQVHLVGTHLDGEIIAACRGDQPHPTLRRHLPDGIRPHPIEGLGEALEGADLVIQGVSSPGVEWAAQTLGTHLPPGLPVLAVTKGLSLGEDGTPRILPDRFNSLLPDGLRNRIPLAAIGGPCIAGELAGRRPTCVVYAGRDSALLDTLAGWLQTDYYRIWTSTDLVGVETCAALKNAFALGVSLSLGLLDRAGGPDGAEAYMHNLAAALCAQAVVEIERAVRLMGGTGELGWSLPGVGDLYVTVQGGRSVAIGQLLGAGATIEEALRRLSGITLESVEIIRTMGEAIPHLERAGRIRSDELPFLRHLAGIVREGREVDLPLGHFFGGSAALRPSR